MGDIAGILKQINGNKELMAQIAKDYSKADKEFATDN